MNCNLYFYLLLPPDNFGQSMLTSGLIVYMASNMIGEKKTGDSKILTKTGS